MDVGVPPSASNTVPIHGTSWKWNSPVPYLYVALAAMLGLISLALLFLACTFGKPHEDDISDDVEKPGKLSLPPPEYEPKFVVIMAGNDEPTYLAKPVSWFDDTRQQQQVGDVCN